jgi:hypothetical protein
MNDRKGLSRRNANRLSHGQIEDLVGNSAPAKSTDFWGLNELSNRIILEHRLVLVSGGEGGRLRSDRASTAKGFVFVKKPYPTRF